MQTAMETFYTDEQNYTLADLDAVKAIEPAIGSGKAVPTVPTHLVDNYVVRSTSKTGNVFTITKSNTGAVERSCTTVKKFGCPTSGSW